MHGVIPDEIAVIGSGLIDDVRKYYSSLPVIKAPAFRYKRIDFERKNYSDKIVNNIIVLAALPVNKDYARDIILMLNEALNYKDNNIEKTSLSIQSKKLLTNSINLLSETLLQNQNQNEIMYKKEETLLNNVF